MSKKITALSVAILLIAISITAGGYGNSGKEYDITTAGINTYAAEETVSSTASIGEYVSQKVDSVTNLGGIIGDVSDIGNSLGGLMGDLGGSSGLGDALGGFGSIGDALSGIFGNSSSSGGTDSGGTGSETYDVNSDTIGYIDIVPAASDFTSVITTQPASETTPANETVDFAATAIPYAKPTGELKGGDKGEGVKWMQWIFIYTRYGLKDDGITGVFDEDTMAVVKKLQKENGFTVDGIVDDEVIDKIELLYFSVTYSTTAPAAATQGTTQPVSAADGSQDNKGDSATELIITFVIIAFIWLLAVSAIVALVIFKKKKGSKKKPNKKQEAVASEGETVIESATVKGGESTIEEMFDKLD